MIAKIKKYAVEFKDLVQGMKYEFFDDQEEALIFANMIKGENELRIVYVYEVEKIIVNNQTYYIYRKTIKML